MKKLISLFLSAVLMLSIVTVTSANTETYVTLNFSDYFSGADNQASEPTYAFAYNNVQIYYDNTARAVTLTDGDYFPRYNLTNIPDGVYDATTNPNAYMSTAFNDNAYIIYKMNGDVTNISLVAFMYRSSRNNAGLPKVYVCADATVDEPDWVGVDMTSSLYPEGASITSTSGTYRYNLNNTNAIPEGMRYVKVCIGDSSSTTASTFKKMRGASRIVSVSIDYKMPFDAKFSINNAAHVFDSTPLSNVEYTDENPLTIYGTTESDITSFTGNAITQQTAIESGYLVYEAPIMDGFELDTVYLFRTGKFAGDLSFATSTDGVNYSDLPSESVVKTFYNDPGKYTWSVDSVSVSTNYKVRYACDALPEGTKYLKILFPDVTVINRADAVLITNADFYYKKPTISIEISSEDVTVTSDRVVSGALLFFAEYDGKTLVNINVEQVDLEAGASGFVIPEKAASTNTMKVILIDGTHGLRPWIKDVNVPE